MHFCGHFGILDSVWLSSVVHWPFNLIRSWSTYVGDCYSETKQTYIFPFYNIKTECMICLLFYAQLFFLSNAKNKGARQEPLGSQWRTQKLFGSRSLACSLMICHFRPLPWPSGTKKLKVFEAVKNTRTTLETHFLEKSNKALVIYSMANGKLQPWLVDED